MLPTLRRLKKTAPATLLVSTTRMDRSGRVHERLLLDELGWHPGRQLDMDTMHGMIIIAATPAGQHTVDTRGAIGLPATLRHLCGIEYGPPLVLAAAAPEQVMVIHAAATVTHLLATHYTDLRQTDHDPRTAPAADVLHRTSQDLTRTLAERPDRLDRPHLPVAAMLLRRDPAIRARRRLEASPASPSCAPLPTRPVHRVP